MRTVPPPDFDVEKFYKGVFLFQKWDVFKGHTAGTRKDVVEHFKRLDAPARMDGLRVLEIAPWNGFFGFECLRRGAREVVALGPDDTAETYFDNTARLLEVEDRIRYIRASVYDIKQFDLGSFDIVLCLGLIYHLRHPLLALDLLHDSCVEKGLFLIDSPIADPTARLGNKDKDLAQAWSRVQEFPVSLFVRGGASLPLSSDAYNWFIPNQECLRAWLRSSGFEIQHELLDPVTKGWHSIKTSKIDRPFVAGLEGYNVGVGKRRPT